jgi:hypothetical protein
MQGLRASPHTADMYEAFVEASQIETSMQTVNVTVRSPTNVRAESLVSFESD